LQYDDIREDDAIYRHKIWKVIDAREKINAPFIYNEDDGNQLFFSIVFKAVVEDSVLAFEDERFRKPYKDLNKFKGKFSGGMDTVDVQDLDGNIISREVRSKEFPVDSVYEFMIMEDVLFDKEASRLVHRIIGIAPMGPTILPSGKVIEGPHFPYFWIYYPDLRKTLAKKPVYNPKNLGARMTWEDYLENHHFSYYVVKSTMDNVKDQNLKEYIKDPMFRLFEGEKIKDKIFNYEQGLWAY
jgi:gliding motility associated protien GldN